MIRSVITAQCIALVTALESGLTTEKVKTAALLRINGTTIEHLIDADKPHQFEVGKSYEVSFSPAAEEPKTEDVSSETTKALAVSDAPASEGVASEGVDNQEMKEAA